MTNGECQWIDLDPWTVENSSMDRPPRLRLGRLLRNVAELLIGLRILVQGLVLPQLPSLPERQQLHGEHR